MKKTTTLFRISSDTALRYKEELARGQDVGGDWELRTEEFARIHWHIFKSSRLIFNGVINEMEDFMPYKGAATLERTFRGPDGKSYTWNVLPVAICNLTLDDGSNPVKTVARMHPPLLLQRNKPYLEIFPEGLHMVELIVVTWVYVEGIWNTAA